MLRSNIARSRCDIKSIFTGTSQSALYMQTNGHKIFARDIDVVTRTEQVRQLLQGIPVAVGSNLLLAVITALVLWDSVSHGGLLIWGGAFIFIQLLRLGLWNIGRHALNDNSSAQWRIFLRVSALLTGLAWGMLPIFLFPTDFPHQVFLLFVAAGVTAAAVAALTVDRVSVLFFIVPTLIPWIVRLFMEDGEIQFAMGAMGTVYLFYLTAASRRGDQAFRDMQALRERESEKSSEACNSERRLNEAQHVARLGSFDWNLVSGDLKWSDEHYRLWCLEPRSVSPSLELFRDGIHPDDLVKVDEALQHARETKEQLDCIYRLQRPGSSERIMHSRGSVTCDEAGQAILMVGTVQDVTERIKSESRLRDSEERLNFAVEGAGDGIWDWNILTGEMPLSGHYEAMLGFNKGELEPTVDAWVKSVHPEDLPRVQSNLQEYLEGKSSIYHIELRLLCKDGSYKWILCRGTLVQRDHDGKPLRMIGIHSDITERKLTEQALIETRDEADRANKAKSEFLSSMSHELRTPMNAILGFGQLLQLDDSLSDVNNDNVHEILRAGAHLLELINEVLDLSKIESGEIDLSLEPVEVSPVIDKCLNLVATLADKRRIRISHAGLKNIVVRADRTRLMQVLLNLLSNAIKYNREGGTVKLEAQAEGTDRLRILVTDTGNGIPAAKLGKLFQPFNRLDAENSGIEGTGIGLTITRRIVELMGGSVNVKSEVGVGSTFWIELPIESVPGLAREQNRAITITTTAPETPAAQQTVLYIEDNPSNLKLVVQLLGHRKHIDLFTAHTPELGIELAMTHQPELIMLDINMPGMNGYQVLEILKAEENLNGVPVVAVTANAMPRDIERGLAAGFSCYLTKPLDVTQFYEVVDKYLNT